MRTLDKPLLFSFRRCPYAMRARMALLVSRTDYVLREVVLRDKPPELVAASPKGTVPVLVLEDGSVLEQSLDIMRWALRRNDPERWLDGDDPDLIAANDGPFKYHLDRYKYPDRHGSDPEQHREQGLLLLMVLERRLASSAHLCGSGRTLTDAAILPFVRQFAATDPAWFAARPIPALKMWLAAGTASPLFVEIMARR